jgi:hypothetical protein
MMGYFYFLFFFYFFFSLLLEKNAYFFLMIDYLPSTPHCCHIYLYLYIQKTFICLESILKGERKVFFYIFFFSSFCIKALVWFADCGNGDKEKFVLNINGFFCLKNIMASHRIREFKKIIIHCGLHNRKNQLTFELEIHANQSWNFVSFYRFCFYGTMIQGPALYCWIRVANKM